jgi:thiamine biosynthesis lipoprotein
VTLATAAVPGIRRVEHIMGMPILVDARDPQADDETLDRVFDWFRFVDATFSTYKPDSEISRLNRGELALAETDPCVREVLDRCEELRLETGGYFDVRFAGSVDPSGLVKGWSVAKAAAILREDGLRNYAINAGGDIELSGRAIPEPCWRVGIQHPAERMKVVGVIEAHELAVATSGSYARGDHVVDPHNGRPPRAPLSVTVVGPDLATADAYATAAFAMDEDGPEWTAQLVGYEAMTLLANDTTLLTRGFPSA